jgi:hypothetical protein
MILCITDAGRTTIDAAPTATGDSAATPGSSESREAPDSKPGTDARHDADAVQQPSGMPKMATTRLGLRGAAQAVLAAWDASGDRLGICPRRSIASAGRWPGPPPPALPAASTRRDKAPSMRRCSRCCAGPRAPAAPADRGRRLGSAHRPRLPGRAQEEGPHVTVLERARQVGPNKQGAKGSYTVYCLAEGQG